MDEVIAEVAIRVQEAEFAHSTSFFSGHGGKKKSRNCIQISLLL